VRDSVIPSAAGADLGPMPLLSRGKHRSPRKGACFMELASYLAGERWSDHPSCTHPLLAALARHVNDLTSDDARPRLTPLIPSVIGLTTEDPRADVDIARRCAAAALPVSPAERQRVLAVSLLSCARVQAVLDRRPAGSLDQRTVRALAQVPDAARWARDFAVDIDTSIEGFRQHAAPTAVRLALDGIARGGVPRADDIYRSLLVGAIEDVRALVERADADAGAGAGADADADAGGGATTHVAAARAQPGAAPTSADPQLWAEACRLTGVTRRR
jgi:hypothetical protein